VAVALIAQKAGTQASNQNGQTMGYREPRHVPQMMELRANTNIAAALAILEDGKPRNGADLLRDGTKLGSFPASTTETSIYTGLTEYIARETMRGRRPEIVQDPKTLAFRVNHPVDDWPQVSLAPRPRNVSSETLSTISALLRSTATGKDPAAFERAVCDAFTLMGFIAAHIGGNDAPDGTLDAPLGPLGYRAILECKTARSGIAENVPPSEPAKFRERYAATAAVIVAPGIKHEVTFFAELKAHDVSFWTVDELIQALDNDVDCYECRELFKGGPVHDRLRDLVWNRTHGPEKRARVIRDVLQRQGFAAQRDLVGQVPWNEMPALTLDVAMVLVEGALRRAGVTGGATREEISSAMDDLVRSFDAVAVPEHGGIVIRTPGNSSATT
jgi:hypothetical protein